ncbi:MAG: hypothetical protein HDQ96_03760 [Lachnospiraceae bacterium]|nr:hypothetical protein [Lachnospiraceae bacterium]
MWCVMHVEDGEEKRTERFLEKFLEDEICDSCFHLTRFRRKKYGGKWQTVQEELLPGYVFIATDEPEKLHKALKRTPEYRLLGSDDAHVSVLEGAEADFIKRIAESGKKSGEIALSKIRVLKDGRVEILSGPLCYMEDLVSKIDLHKRTAEIETDFMGQKKRLYLGVEFEDVVCDTNKARA